MNAISDLEQAMTAQEKPVLVFMAGSSGSGKTTVVADLLPRLQAQGLRVAVVKHAQHLQLAESKDSSRYLQQGAALVAAISPQATQVLAAPAKEPDLEEVLTAFYYLPNVDMVLVEGYKNTKRTKVEVLRQGVNQGLYAPAAELLCVVTDCPVAVPPGLPHFTFEQQEQLTAVVLQWYFDEYNRLQKQQAGKT